MIIRNVVAVVALSALAVACGGSNPEPETAAGAEEAAEEAAPAEAAPAAEEAAPAEAAPAAEEAAPAEAAPADAK